MMITHFHRKPMVGNFSIETLFQDLRDALPEGVETNVITCPFESRGIWARARNIQWARQHQGPVNHITGDVTYLALGLDRKKTISTIHDCGNLERLRGWKRVALKWLWFDLAIRRSTIVTVISGATKRRLQELVKCPEGKIRVVHNPISARFRPSSREFNSVMPTVLHVGTKPNKNLERHAAALKDFRCRLRVIGRLDESQRACLLRNQIEFESLIDLSADAVVRAYEECDLLLFASTYEGFGLPIAEANAVGRPVITSRTWSMPEVAGDAAILVNPENVEEIRYAVTRVVSDPGIRNQLIEAGFRNVQRFRPEIIARAYCGIYAEVAGMNSP